MSHERKSVDFGLQQDANKLDTNQQNLVQPDKSFVKKPFELLNQELLLKVFSWLSLQDINQCLLVCRKWNRVANDNKVWFFFFFLLLFIS